MGEQKIFDDVETREGETFTEETLGELSNGKGDDE